MRLHEIQSSEDDLPMLTKEHKILSYMRRGAGLYIRNRWTLTIKEAFLLRFQQGSPSGWWTTKDTFYRIHPDLVSRIIKHPDTIHYGFAGGQYTSEVYVNKKFLRKIRRHVETPRGNA